MKFERLKGDTCLYVSNKGIEDGIAVYVDDTVSSHCNGSCFFHNLCHPCLGGFLYFISDVFLSPEDSSPLKVMTCSVVWFVKT